MYVNQTVGKETSADKVQELPFMMWIMEALHRPKHALIWLLTPWDKSFSVGKLRLPNSQGTYVQCTKHTEAS